MAKDPSAVPDRNTGASATEMRNEANGYVAEIRELLDQAKAALITIQESQSGIGNALVEAQGKLAEITSAATQSVAARTQITDIQTVVATKSQHIEDAQVHADKVRADLDRKLTEATQHATEAEGVRSRAQTAADSAAEVLVAIRTTQGSADTDSGAIAKARQTAEESAEIAKGLADRSAVTEKNLANYEKRLADLEEQCADRLKTIDALLPGATSAGLAHSLDTRRQGFLKPQKRWQAFFVGCLVGIVIVAINGLLHVYQMKTVPTYDELARLWLARLPVAGALLWLALHASREAALAKRLEEDYGYKSAVASSFEGFRRQMADIVVELKADSPLAKLCADTLATLAMPPGRIYDKHKLTVSPLDELRESAKTLTEGAKPIAEVAKTLKVPGAG